MSHKPTLPVFELCDMTPQALWDLAVSEARKAGADVAAIGAEVMRRMSFAPLPQPQHYRDLSGDHPATWEPYQRLLDL